jgi:hypothetical protein
MSFIRFETTKDKGIGIGMLCILPVLVLVIFVITFSIKTKRDLCNVSNYICDPPTTKAQSQEQTKIYEIRSCSTPTTKPGHDLIDSSSSLNGYIGTAIFFILLVIALLISYYFFTELGTDRNKKTIWRYFFTNAGLDIDDESIIWTFRGALILIAVLLIASVIYLGMSRKANKANNVHIGFSISFINILITLILTMFLSSNKSFSTFFFTKPSNYTSYGYVILSLILIIFIIGTIYFHTSQKENLDEGKITYAINESVVNMMAPIMLVISLANLLIGGGMIKNSMKQKQIDKLRLTFGITQIISGILLVAGAAYFYNYKAKCSSATITCAYSSKNIDRGSGEDMCTPYSGMSMTHSSSVTMGISLSVIMSLIQIVGSVIVILIPATVAAGTAETATLP